jgi:hypothetical protein
MRFNFVYVPAVLNYIPNGFRGIHMLQTYWIPPSFLNLLA